LTAEEISKQLSLARSTVSTGIRELQSWGILKVTQVLGDRRDHFQVMDEVWEMFRAILHERKQREIDPTLMMLRECVAEMDLSDTEQGYLVDRLGQMLDFFEVMTAVYDQIDGMPTETLKKMAKAGDRLSAFLSRLTQG
jgi:DNA-binding transcriptional regulator GbsR (MarR family)